jgi:plastocyanin
VSYQEPIASYFQVKNISIVAPFPGRFEPYSIVANVGDTITWTNKDYNGHSISHTSNYEQTHYDSMDGSINIILAPEQSPSMKFSKAGQYDYCVSWYNGYVHGVIIIKDKQV